MSREIKFDIIYKNKSVGIERLDKKGWEWQYFELNPDKGERWTTGVMHDSLMIRRQFTGLKDKNGKEIYDRDIVQWDFQGVTKIYKKRGQIRFACNEINISSFGITYFELEKEIFTCFFDSSIEIIGNIYENPKLLKQK